MAFSTNNNLTSITEEYWAQVLQEEFFKRLTSQHVSSMNLEARLSKGDTFNKSYLDASENELDVYSPGTNMSVETETTTNEQLLINKAYGQAREIDDFEDVQAAFSFAAAMAPKDAQRFANRVDVDVMAEIANAQNTLDNGVLGGGASDGVGIDPTTSNIVSVFSHATRLFEESNVTDGRKVAVVSPKVGDIIMQYLAGRDTGLGDASVLDGALAKFMMYDVYVSNHNLATAVLSLATQPTNADTVTIDGVTFTFVSSIGATAGNVLIGANVDETRGHLAAFLADPGTTNGDQIGFATTSEAYKKLTNRIVSATNDNTADTLTIQYAGRSAITVTETLTDPTDTWTANQTLASAYFACGDPTNIVTQDVPSVEITRKPLGFADYVKRGSLYGLKTFRDGTFRQVKVDFLA